MPTPDLSPAHVHEEARARAEAKVDALEARTRNLGLMRLGAFLGAVVMLGVGIQGGQPLEIVVGAALAMVFVALVVWNARLLDAMRDAETRRDVHKRHIDRLAGSWVGHPSDSAERLGGGHPYALDVDLVGRGSLVQRVDVTHTVAGISALLRYLATPADADEIALRQAAVRELAPQVPLRESLEAAAGTAAGTDKLDAAPFMAFVARAPLFRSGLGRAAIVISPIILLTLIGLAAADVVPHAAWAVYVTLQGFVTVAFGRHTSEAFDLIAARRGYVEAFRAMLVTVEEARFEAPKLRAIQGTVSVDGEPPSRYLADLDRYAGFAELRTQFPIHLIVNFVLLWDLNVLARLERWNSRVGRGISGAFEALGELEALSALACLHYLEPSSIFPEIVPSAEGFVAEDLAHPLLAAERRIANSLSLPGPGSALIVTGSNMAGKSTLLRAIGLNIALALAGGPVLASRMRLPSLRLRASMRIDDDLQRGASYFHAELSKLRSVAADADGQPPIFFLLDELLRGTNAEARHIGGRSVLLHLLHRGALGVAATHDLALAELEQETSVHVRNVHFTDVMDGDEMIFDYRLRQGVVRTSNALRLLSLAGIELEESSSAAPSR